jgi:hypothetical protein
VSGFRRILHASDFSRASATAFRRAIVHVYTPVVPILSAGYLPLDAYERLSGDARAAAQRQLDRLVARATTAGVRGSGRLTLAKLLGDLSSRADRARSPRTTP